MKRITLIISILLVLVVAGSLVASCTQQEVTKTSTVTTTIAGQDTTTTVTNTQTITSTIATSLPPITTTPTTSPPTTTTTTMITTTTTPPPTSTSTPTTTAGELASFGGTLYEKTCTLAADCHARFGQGGEEEFTAANLAEYGNAETLFGIISSIMHLAIGDYQEDAPSLEEYLQILAYILVQNGTVQPSDPFDRSSLPHIPLD